MMTPQEEQVTRETRVERHELRIEFDEGRPRFTLVCPEDGGCPEAGCCPECDKEWDPNDHADRSDCNCGFERPDGCVLKPWIDEYPDESVFGIVTVPIAAVQWGAHDEGPTIYLSDPEEPTP